jgi:septal ring factor EnvC (AmiA/AmiB activator)
MGPPVEKRSQGPLVATIDLLFLLICFFLLLLFTMQQQRKETQAQLEATQESLARITGEQTTDVRQALKSLEPLLETFMVKQREQVERQRALAARDVRRRQRETVRLDYQVLPGNRIHHEGRIYSLSEFRAQVVTRLRQKNWISFRAVANAETPFGEVVAHRRLLLENMGEFDTYWDNVSPPGPEAGKPRP